QIYAHLEQTVRGRREAELERDMLTRRLNGVKARLSDVSARVLHLEAALRMEQANHAMTKREYLDARHKLDNASGGWSAALHDIGSCGVCGAPATATLVPCEHNICEGHKMRDCACDLPFGTHGRCTVHGMKAHCPCPSCRIEIEQCGRRVSPAVSLLSARHVALKTAESYCRETIWYAKAVADELREQDPSLR
ncbi:hypothetical protein EV121DRAFT_218056, partial [Schizophyllum commune]